MKNILLLQLRPEDLVADSEYQAFLRVGEIPPERVERLRIETTGIPDINPKNYTAIIVGGSPFDISSKEQHKSAAQKKVEADFRKLFDTVVPEDIPFLGACSGNGLLGSYLGANISRRFGESVGGVDIQITEAGRNDPLLQNLPADFKVLVGHKEACDATPPGATLLATSSACPVQMFRVKHNIYATQFHPESDAGVFITRINAYKHNGYFAPHDAQKMIDKVSLVDASISHKVLKNFVAQYCNP